MIARLAAVACEDDGPDPNFLEARRIAEALLFAASEPLEENVIAERLPPGPKVADVLDSLKALYAGRGVNLVRVASKWTFRTAVDLAWLLSKKTEEQKKLSKPALETLSIIAYHQPVTRAEIEDVRGVAISKGTLDLLLETGWVRLRGRRRAPGRPVTYGTTEAFLLHFGLEQIGDLPGLDELRAAGLFDGRLPPGFGVPSPKDDAGLLEDEDPLEEPASDSNDIGDPSENAQPDPTAGTGAEAQREENFRPLDEKNSATSELDEIFEHADEDVDFDDPEELPPGRAD